MTTLTEQLKGSVKQAMLAKDKVKLGAVRMALAAIKQIEVDTRETLDDTQVLAVLTKMVKQRRDAIEQYTAAGRDELAQAEAAEVEVIESFLPQPLTDAEIATLIDEAIATTSASSMADMGKVMGALKPKVQGRADMGALSALIKAKLQ